MHTNYQIHKFKSINKERQRITDVQLRTRQQHRPHRHESATLAFSVSLEFFQVPLPQSKMLVKAVKLFTQVEM